ncbi:MAG: agmatinase family protein [Acidimicrobiia bacterium]
MAINDPYWPRADAWLNREADNPDIRVVGVPSSAASLSPSRSDLTPLAVRDRFSRFSTFHGEWGIDFGEVTVCDEGNWPVSELDMHEMPGDVEKRARNLDPAALTIFLGGDNAITRPLVRAQHDEIERVGVITFDAHHDVRTLDLGPANGTPIRGLIEEDGLPGANVTQVGIHSFANSAFYRKWCDDHGVSVVTVEQVRSEGLATVVTAALERLSTYCKAIYVDIDVDVLDAAYAPGCPGARPGGLTVRELADGVRRCGAHPLVSAMDLVEVDAAADPTYLTLDAMAHLALSAAAGYSERS